jgi:hypothetical protein
MGRRLIKWIGAKMKHLTNNHVGKTILFQDFYQQGRIIYTGYTDGTISFVDIVNKYLGSGEEGDNHSDWCCHYLMPPDQGSYDENGTNFYELLDEMREYYYDVEENVFDKRFFNFLFETYDQLYKWVEKFTNNKAEDEKELLKEQIKNWEKYIKNYNEGIEESRKRLKELEDGTLQ